MFDVSRSNNTFEIMANFNNTKVKAILVKWGLVLIKGVNGINGTKIMAGQGLDGKYYVTSELIPKIFTDPLNPVLHFALTESGSVYAVIKDNRDDTFAQNVYFAVLNNNAKFA